MTDLLSVVAVSLYGGVLALLLPFAAHRISLLLLSRRPAPGSLSPTPPPHPRVTVQLPIYNEPHVVERLIDATCRLSHPRHLLQIQVLDDSTDDTAALARQRAHEWRRRGIDITVLHRTNRHGYKAGALAEGLDSATGDYILILDADFVPQPGLLEELLPSMVDPRVGMVQARWEHLNENESWLTRAQALLLDGHFLVEQRGRYRGGRFFKFNGTAGLWRRKALDDAGGWDHDTLTEDLDISYRSQMAGWQRIGGANYGKKSRKFNQDCTICASCRWIAPAFAVTKPRENRRQMAGIAEAFRMDPPIVAVGLYPHGSAHPPRGSCPKSARVAPRRVTKPVLVIPADNWIHGHASPRTRSCDIRAAQVHAARPVRSGMAARPCRARATLSRPEDPADARTAAARRPGPSCPCARAP